jgi:hypothetical protein
MPAHNQSSEQKHFNQYMDKLNKRIKQNGSSFSLRGYKFSNYLLGFLLVPWVWVWGYLFLATVLVAILYSRNNEPAVQLAMNLQSSMGVYIYTYWMFTVLSVWLNYTIAFFCSKRYIRLNTLIFLMTLLLMLFLLIQLWPYFGFIFK